MKLIGVVTGTYEGNNWARLVMTEPIAEGKGFGCNAIVSKASYNFVALSLIPQLDLYLGQDVRAFYDRFGKVVDLQLDRP